MLESGIFNKERLLKIAAAAPKKVRQPTSVLQISASSKFYQ
jgi:hypothetical protein